MRKSIRILSIFATFIALQYSCREIEEFPETPAIEFEDFMVMKDINGLDSMGILILGFTDGDGDLGVSSNDSSVNYFLDIFEVVNGEPQQVELPDSSVNFNAYIPNLTPEGKYKGIKGSIYYFLPLYFMMPFLETDTIFFETSIVDRAMHESNMITTPLIVLD